MSRGIRRTPPPEEAPPPPLRGRAALLGLIALLLVLWPLSGHAQESGGGFSDDSLPLEIGADQGIDWREADKTYTARGNATVKRGDTELAADTLVFFASQAGGDVDRIRAQGHVRLTRPGATAHGGAADYDDRAKLLVMRGEGLRVEREGDRITAAERIEFWVDKDAIQALGDVVIRRPDTTIAGRKATLYFRKDQAGKSQLRQIEVEGNVRADNGKQRVTCDRLVYDPDTEISLLSGHVTVIDGASRFSGARAEIDNRRKIGRLQGGAGSRVISVIKPKAAATP